MSVSSPGEPGYADATRVFNLAAPARPAAAVTARSVADVRDALRFAAAEGLPVRTHTTGHAAAAGAPMDGALLIRTELAGAVEVDTARGLARMPAGTRWGAVVEATTPHGYTTPHGSSATVGVVGYLLGGGLSFYGRRVGLAANGVRAVELVTADGEPRRVDATTDPELFRALRGGGGGFGVVTAVEIDLFPATTVVTGAAFWPAVHARRLVSAWTRWCETAPDVASTSLRVMNLPDVPDVPRVLSQGPMVCVDGVVLAPGADPTGAQAVAAELLGPLRTVAPPVMDTWRVATPADVPAVHMDPPEPVPFLGDHLLLRELGDDGVAAFVGAVGQDSGSPLVIAGLRQLGGAFAAPDVSGGVLNHVDARYSYSGSGVPLGPLTPEALLRYCGVVRAALAPWDTGRTLPTFVEHADQPQRHLTAEQVAAVDRVRTRVDPHGRFRGDVAVDATAIRPAA
jgi:hypothetical protein